MYIRLTVHSLESKLTYCRLGNQPNILFVLVNTKPLHKSKHLLLHVALYMYNTLCMYCTYNYKCYVYMYKCLNHNLQIYDKLCICI